MTMAMRIRDDRLPAFLVIGAVKAATTWIAHQLRQHPALWLPDAEPHYFSSDYHRGIDWYRSLFEDAPAGRIVGEKSADYLAHPEAPARIAATLPGVPMVVQLRDPVERAYSDYCMLFRRGMVGGDPRRYLDIRHTGEVRFLEGGRYAHALRRLFAHIPRERVQIILYEDIRAAPERVISSVCGHIGVPVHITETAVAARRNDSRSPMLPLSMRRMLKPARPLLDPLRHNPWLSRIRAAMARPVHYPPLTDELRQMLRAYYADDVAQLETMLGRDLAAWSGASSTSEPADRQFGQRRQSR